MNYRVYQDDKRCSSYMFESWETDTFFTFEEAVEYAERWAYPYESDDPAEPNKVMHFRFGTMEIKTL